MFKVGDKILYGAEGVCEIIDITEKNFNEVSALFYVLKPKFSNSSTFFVPTESEKLTSKMKPVLSLEEIQKFVKTSCALRPWQDDDALRKEDFKSIISGGNTEKIVSMLKAIILHKNEIERMGKKLHRADESAFKDAQKIIYEEFRLYTELTKDDIIKIISDEI